MVEKERLTEIMTLLDSVANAPLTDSQRLQRAEPVLKLSGLSLEEIASTLDSPDLPWNQRKAGEYGVDVNTWLEALGIVRLPQSPSLLELLSRVHQAEAAVAMLKAGYRAQVEPSGRINWLSPQRT